MMIFCSIVSISPCPTPPPSFQSSFIPHPLSSASRIHLVSCDAPASKSSTPLLLVHGLGSSASFWLPALSTAQGKTLTSQRQVYAIDAYGHGVSDFVSAEDSLDRATETVVGVIEHLLKESGQDKVILAGHSMSGVSHSTSFQSYSLNRCAARHLARRRPSPRHRLKTL